jgi:DNA-binding GntR family transcriptional regulator
MSEHKSKPTRPSARKAVPTKPVRYIDLARDLTEAIASGRFPVGSLLPTEFELCDQYCASRHTVRMAIGELEKLGLVTRRKKVGTRVEAASPPSGYRLSLASVEDLVQFGATHKRDVRRVEKVVLDQELARLLGCATGTSWLRISTLRRDGPPDTPPVGWTDVYVDPAYSDLGNLARKSPEVLISSLIEQRYGRRMVEIRQDVQATLIPEQLAEVLEVEERTAALRIVRRYFDATGKIFEATVTVHPADRFTVSTRMRRESNESVSPAPAPPRA